MNIRSIENFAQAQRDRLAFIEFRLWFLGDISRRDLMERFGIAPAMATRDLAAYRDLAPGNIDFEGSRKIYVTGKDLSPLFAHHPERVLSALSKGFGDGTSEATQGYLPFESPLRLNRPSLPVLATISRAIHQRKVVRVKYHSLKRGPSKREIIPHALVDSGLRWHVRVYDREFAQFRDLVLSRIESPVLQADSIVAAHELSDRDEQWTQIIALELAPHPNHAWAEIVARDFGMTKDKLIVKVRAAIAGYLLRLWNVDCSADNHLDPGIHRLWLRNTSVLCGVISAAIAPGA
jgi:predicted DNA-binding transcriptional regulator YafY